jgi:two-component system cell cycle response regulator CpdR
MVTLPTSNTPTPAKPLAVIVADDVEEILHLVGRCLEDVGHVVSYATTGAEVIRLLGKQPCDLAIVDVLMPDGDGLDVIFAVKRSHPGTRVLAISGGGKYMVAAECLRVARGVGADGVLLKPFGRQQLLDAIESVMNS